MESNLNFYNVKSNNNYKVKPFSELYNPLLEKASPTLTLGLIDSKVLQTSPSLTLLFVSPLSLDFSSFSKTVLHLLYFLTLALLFI